MDEELQVADNTEEVATPQIDSDQSTEPEVTAEPTANVDSEPQQQEDITQTQSFAKRLKEETSKSYQKAQDELIASMYGESHGIYTKADYDKAVAEYQDQQRMQELIDNQGVPEDVARELIESKKFRQQYETEQKARRDQESRQKDFQAFIEEYPDVKANEIPDEVWVEHSKGKSLIDAYGKYENKMLKQRVAEFEKGIKTQEINQVNAASSTGSVTGNGRPTTKEITAESIATMSEKEISANWNQVKKILGMR